MTCPQINKYHTFVRCNCSNDLEKCICMIDNDDKEHGILTALLCISVMLLLKEVWTIITKLGEKYDMFKTAKRNEKQKTSSNTLKDKIYISQPTTAEIQYNATEKRLLFHFCAEPDKNLDGKLAVASKHRVGSEKSSAASEHRVGSEQSSAASEAHRVGSEKSSAASEHRVDSEKSSAANMHEVGGKNSADYELVSPLFCQRS